MLNKDKAVLIKALRKLNTEELTHVVYHFDEDGVEKLCECLFNTIHTDLKLPKNKQKKIRSAFANQKSTKNLHLLINKRNKKSKGKNGVGKIKRKRLFSMKKKALLQEGEGLGLILGAIAPLIAKLFTG